MGVCNICTETKKLERMFYFYSAFSTTCRWILFCTMSRCGSVSVPDVQIMFPRSKSIRSTCLTFICSVYTFLRTGQPAVPWTADFVVNLDLFVCWILKVNQQLHIETSRARTFLWKGTAHVVLQTWGSLFATSGNCFAPAIFDANISYLFQLLCYIRRCPTLSNPVPWQNWMEAYLDYTLWMKTLFRGWPVMVHDMHTRRRINNRIAHRAAMLVFC